MCFKGIKIKLTSIDHQQAEETTHAAVAAEETEETTHAGGVAEMNGTAAAEVEGTRTEVAAIGTAVLAIGTGTATAEETGEEIATATPPTPDTPAETDRPTTGRLLLRDHPT